MGYCANIPTNPCPANTACLTYTCNATAGACDVTDVGAACTSDDICKKPSCNPSTGCVKVDKTAAEIAAQCNDNNACTIDTCASNACVYTPSVTCQPNDACDTYTCNPATGACDKTSLVCNDNNECTIDTCNNVTGCVYTNRTQAQINALCNPGSCEQATCVTRCVNSPLVPVPPVCNSDPCIRDPCPSPVDNNCERTVCINQANGTGITCESVPAGPQRTECLV